MILVIMHARVTRHYVDIVFARINLLNGTLHVIQRKIGEIHTFILFDQ